MSAADASTASSPHTPAICVIVVAYNAGRHLAACIASLQRQRWTDFEAIIVDNGSADGSIEALGPLPVPFRLLPLGANLGFAAANNRGAAASRSPWIALLNPDAVAAPDWLERLMAAARRHPEFVMFGSTQIQLADETRWDGLGDVYHASGIPWRGGFGQRVTGAAPEGEVFGPCAAAALYRRDAFEAAGGFDERFFCYFEDVDLCFRLRLAGERIVFAPRAVVRHVGSASTGRTSDFAVYHGTRNRVFTFVKDMPALLWPLALPCFVLVQLYLLWRSRRLAVFSPTWRGMRDGFAGAGRFFAGRPGGKASLARTLEIARMLSWSPLAL
ncbi:MAG TPA: glycosyltransferase family 2 protein, partial [Hypericibacter adhaerens]|uniref:glycosyltransferase family 2 protein n=1 Tax=Hypericibacter adhaerens TaxID=2602016 RepID=UPI002BBDAD78